MTPKYFSAIITGCLLSLVLLKNNCQAQVRSAVKINTTAPQPAVVKQPANGAAVNTPGPGTQSSTPNNLGISFNKASSVYQPVIFKYRTPMTDGSVLQQQFTVYKPHSFTQVSLNMAQAGDGGKAKPKIVNRQASLPQQTNCGKKTCSSVTQYLSANNIQEFGVAFINNNLLQYVYPGALYHASDFLNGAFKPVQDERNTMALTTSVKNIEGNKPNYINVGNPNYTTLTNGVSQLFYRHSNNEGEVGYEGFYYTMSKIESAAEIDFKLNAGGHYLFASASLGYSSKSKQYHKYLLINGYKKMFSITASPGAVTSGSSNAWTVTKPSGNGLLKDPDRLSPDMVYINSVTYGARVLALVELNVSSDETDVNFDAEAEFGFAGGSVGLKNKMNSFNSEMNISFFAVGGPSSAATTVRSFDEMEAKVQQLFSGLNYKNAQPISYTMADIDGNAVSCNSATDQFTSNICAFETDKKVAVDNLTIDLIDPRATDVEFYGQIWAQVFDGKGKEVLPVYGKDRLFDVKTDQHLSAASFSKGVYKTGLKTEFIIPASSFAGSRVIIYYWILDKDNWPNPDDLLTMQNGYMAKYNRNQLSYYIKEYRFTGSETGEIKDARLESQFVDTDGQSGINIKAILTSTPANTDVSRCN